MSVLYFEISVLVRPVVGFFSEVLARSLMSLVVLSSAAGARRALRVSRVFGVEDLFGLARLGLVSGKFDLSSFRRSFETAED